MFEEEWEGPGKTNSRHMKVGLLANSHGVAFAETPRPRPISTFERITGSATALSSLSIPGSTRISFGASFSSKPVRLDENGVARRAMAEMVDQGAPSTVGPRSLHERGQLV